MRTIALLLFLSSCAPNPGTQFIYEDTRARCIHIDQSWCSHIPAIEQAMRRETIGKTVALFTLPWVFVLRTPVYWP